MVFCRIPFRPHPPFARRPNPRRRWWPKPRRCRASGTATSEPRLQRATSRGCPLTDGSWELLPFLFSVGFRNFQRFSTPKVREVGWKIDGFHWFRSSLYDLPCIFVVVPTRDLKVSNLPRRKRPMLDATVNESTGRRAKPVECFLGLSQSRPSPQFRVSLWFPFRPTPKLTPRVPGLCFSFWKTILAVNTPSFWPNHWIGSEKKVSPQEKDALPRSAFAEASSPTWTTARAPCATACCRAVT